MSPLTLTQRLVRKPDQIFTDMDGDTVMMEPESGRYFGISGTGSRIWKLLEQPQTVNAIIETICAEYEVDIEQCEADTLAFCQSLLDNQLAEIQA
ncbi:lasso peptide biosynthesis PqqD family chaperone [Celerinatantimonas sp. YJH-8]|uniref:lasso peptide biosynthesis PqqD family chaperone n=1 Tax=Celerinatantimonas sp. YJH-8 TaxID=3228714 RepID=UPI0038C536A4